MCMALVRLAEKVESENRDCEIGVATFHCRVQEPTNCHTATADLDSASDVCPWKIEADDSLVVCVRPRRVHLQRLKGIGLGANLGQDEKPTVPANRMQPRLGILGLERPNQWYLRGAVTSCYVKMASADRAVCYGNGLRTSGIVVFVQ